MNLSAKQILKKTAIIIGVIAAMYLLILFVAGIYLNTQKATIRHQFETVLKEKLNGDFKIGQIDISVWKHFPAIGFRMEDFTLTDSVYHRPIIHAKLVATRFSIFGLLSSAKTVNDILIKDASFHLFTDSTGYTNKYLLTVKKQDSANNKSKAHTDISVDMLQCNNLDVLIEDIPKQKRIEMVINKLKVRSRQRENLLKITMDEDISMKKGLGFKLSKGAYLENQRLTGKWVLTYQMKTGMLSFDKTNIKVSNHPFSISGNFVFMENPKFKLFIQSRGLKFELAKSIVTQHIRQKVVKYGMELDGAIDTDIQIEGSLLPNTKPAVNLNWNTTNSKLKTRFATVTACSFSANFMNSIHPDSIHDDANSKLSLKTFSCNWDGVKIIGKNIVVTNLQTPVLQFQLHSDCSLKDLDDKFALSKFKFLSGKAVLDLSYNGPVTEDASMFQDVEGRLMISNGGIVYVPRSFTFTGCNGSIEFFKDSLRTRNFSCLLQKNKIDIQLDGKNIRRKLVTGDESKQTVLNCRLHASYLNLEDFIPLLTVKNKSAATKNTQNNFAKISSKFDDMMDNSVFNLLATADQIKHQQLLAKNFTANIALQTSSWQISKLDFSLAGGQIALSGNMNNGVNNHQADVDIEVNQVGIKQLFTSFNDFGMKDLKAANLDGVFSTRAKIRVSINDKGILMPGSLQGGMNFSLKNGALKQFAPLKNLKAYVFKKRNLDDVRFAEIASDIDMNGTGLFLNRMEIASNVFRMYVEGNYDLSGKNTDLLLQIPFYNLNNKNFDEDEMPVNKGIKQDKKNIWLRAKNNKDGQVKLTLTVKPKFKAGTKEQGTD